MIRNPILRNGRRQRGQGMTEYIIIVALIAIAAIGVFSAFGKTVRNQAAGIAKEISGVSGSSQVQKAGEAAGDAASRANADKGMAKYHEGNDAQ